ncbi:uncharacterized protein LOC102656349 isoform X3 [Apis mellifera]|uniref:Uncharacterized protein LOC102656349 isoform X3 n=1 Tax=Apis mellifera TaxID=7460 RepID=A0A7M7MWG6_APIME|nr:uncharacterized protein LOC102656349 isoform X3 [Apis mellifera]|eukprot:XP_026301572.1 uncharacterized protein LOC102656349 isoform X3 [Apis mellifera]
MAGLPRICDIERQKWCCNSDLLLNIRVLAGNRVQCPKVTGSEFIDRSRMRGMSVSTLSKIRRSSIQWITGARLGRRASSTRRIGWQDSR